jgi:hypothetical protein
LERRRHDLQQPAGITDVVVDVEQPTAPTNSTAALPNCQRRAGRRH